MNAQIPPKTLKFTLAEKIYAQFTYNVGVFIGAYGLYLVNPLLGLAFLLYAYVTIFLLMRFTVCPRCPHLKIAEDCVQLHPALVKVIISDSRKGPLNNTEKLIYFAALYGPLLLPLYWLISNWIILGLFLLIYGGSLLGLHLHFCKHCQNKECIQCRNK